MDECMQKAIDDFCSELFLEKIKTTPLKSIKSDAIEFITKEDSHFVPIKTSKEELLKVHKCQREMLEYMFKCYKSAVGTEKEEFMRKMYNDSLIDYKDFLEQHRDILFE